MPHGLASDKQLQKNEFVVFDFGAYREAYASDVTRTLFLGKPTMEQRRVYQTVLEAVVRTEENLRPNQLGSTVDELARSWIDQAGFGDYFGHGTGHGVGLEVHEAPFIHARQKERIRRNMVFTIEPGIYLPDMGGVRIEDIVRVTDSGCEVLTEYSKDLIVV
jgi:Xaa-Pro aminopeptidase